MLNCAFDDPEVSPAVNVTAELQARRRNRYLFKRLGRVVDKFRRLRISEAADITGSEKSIQVPAAHSLAVT